MNRFQLQLLLFLQITRRDWYNSTSYFRILLGNTQRFKHETEELSWHFQGLNNKVEIHKIDFNPKSAICSPIYSLFDAIWSLFQDTWLSASASHQASGTNPGM